MNNNTKTANVMTWAKFKRKFNPELRSSSDNTFGTKQIVQPTLRYMGFYEDIIMDADEEIKPLQQVKDRINIMKWSYVVYYGWKYRDGSGLGISIFYK